MSVRVTTEMDEILFKEFTCPGFIAVSSRSK